MPNRSRVAAMVVVAVAAVPAHPWAAIPAFAATY